MRNTSRLLVLVFIASALYFHSVGASTGGPTEPSYQPGPSGRGTLGLLSTCIITLLLCVWTAIHMNVPARNERGKWTRLWKKARWALFALFAPEMVVWRAFAQRQSARKLRDACNIISERREAPSVEELGSENEGRVRVTDVERNSVRATVTEKEKWSLSEGFFGIMGGFEVKHPELERNHFLYAEQYTLTPQGVQLLFELDLLPSVKALKHSINDKNKADSLAKGLICFQTVWMVVQTIARKISALPVTLLEVNTIAHVICAVVLYVLWWEKPQDVKEPEVIRIEDPRLAAYLCGPEVFYRHDLHIFTDREERNKSSCSDDGNEGPTHVSVPARHLHEDSLKPETQPLSSNATNTQNQFQRAVLSPRQQLVGTNFGSRNVAIELESWEVEQLHLLSALWNPLGILAQNISTQSKPWRQPWKYHYKARRASNMEIKGNLGDEDSDRYITGFNSFSDSLPTLAVLSFLYGGIHLTSWNSHFPSNVEEMMWRISGSIVASGGLVIYLLTRISERTYDSPFVAPFGVWKAWTFRHVLDDPIFTISGLLLRIWVVLYGVARVYIITEAFVGLRSLPLGAYSTIHWVDTLPHI